MRRSITITNITQQAVRLRLDTTPLFNSAFILEDLLADAPSPSGSLSSASVAAVRSLPIVLSGGQPRSLNFVAQGGQPLPNDGILRLPLYVEAETRAFAHIELRATHLSAQLQVADKLLDFGCTPVGAVRTLRTYLSFSAPQEEPTRIFFSSEPALSEMNVIVSMADGSLLSDKPIPVDVVLKSSVPSSVAFKLKFSSAAGHQADLNCVGIVDNSAFSQVAEVSNNVEEAASNLSRCFQLFGTPQPTPIAIPQTFLERCGWPLADIIGFIQGEPVPGLPLTRPETLSREQQRKVLQITIDYLVAQGALLAHVDIDALWSSNEKDSKRAWCILLAQVLRVFVLPRWPSLRRLAGPGNCLPQGSDTLWAKVRDKQ